MSHRDVVRRPQALLTLQAVTSKAENLGDPQAKGLAYHLADLPPHEIRPGRQTL